MRPLYRDLIERVVWTFAQAFVGALSIDTLLLEGELAALHVAAVAGVAAALAVVKGFAAARLGDLDSAATLRSGHLEEAADVAHIMRALRDPDTRRFPPPPEGTNDVVFFSRSAGLDDPNPGGGDGTE